MIVALILHVFSISTIAVPNPAHGYEKGGMQLKIANWNLKDFDMTFEPAFEFIKTPYKHWDLGDAEDKRMVQKPVFSDHLTYNRLEGFRTPKNQ